MKTTQPTINPFRFDATRLVNRQLRAIKRNPKNADFLVTHLAKDFIHRITATNRQFEYAADLLTFSDKLCDACSRLENINQITRFELPPIANALSHKSTHRLLPMPDPSEAMFNQVDLIISLAGLHNHDQLPRFLRALVSSMKKDAMMLIALPISGTLSQLQSSLTQAELEICDGAMMRIDPFISLQQAGDLLQQAGFKLPVLDKEEITVRYDDMFALINDLRDMGVTSARFSQNHRYAGRKLFKRANEIYNKNFSDPDGRIRASFNFAFLTAWSPHENQPEPLKPGSGQISLAKHLKKNR